MKKYSLVGIALLAATAVTSAFMPSNAKPDDDDLLDGVLILSDVSEDWTCTIADVGGFCSYTVTRYGFPDPLLSATGLRTETSNSTNIVAGMAIDIGTTDDLGEL